MRDHRRAGARQTGDPALGARLREARVASGRTQTEFAEELGVSQRAVSSFETGARMPKPGFLARVAELLGVPTDVLLHSTPDVEWAPVLGKITDLEDGTTGPIEYELRDLVMRVDLIRVTSEGKPRHTLEGYPAVPLLVPTNGRRLFYLLVDADRYAPLVQRGDLILLDADASPQRGQLVFGSTDHATVLGRLAETAPVPRLDVDDDTTIAVQRVEATVIGWLHTERQREGGRSR